MRGDEGVDKKDRAKGQRERLNTDVQRQPDCARVLEFSFDNYGLAASKATQPEMGR
jgi:hypothetical protein